MDAFGSRFPLFLVYALILIFQIGPLSFGMHLPRRYPNASAPAQQCPALLSRTAAQVPERPVLFDDVDIYESVPMRPVQIDIQNPAKKNKEISSHAWATTRGPIRYVFQQSGMQDNALATALTMRSDSLTETFARRFALPLEDSSDDRQLSLEEALEGLGTPGMRKILRVTPDTHTTIASLQEILEKYGSAAVLLQWDLDDQVMPHWVVLDEINGSGERMYIRDPYHGWAIAVRPSAVLELLPDPQKIDLIFLKTPPQPTFPQKLQRYFSWRKNQKTSIHKGEDWRQIALRRQEKRDRLQHQEQALALALEKNYRPLVFSETIAAMNVLREQIPLYSVNTLEHIKLRFAQQVFEMRLLRLEIETAIIEYRLEQVRRKKSAAEKFQAEAELNMLTLHPEHEGIYGNTTQIALALKTYHAAKQNPSLDRLKAEIQATESRWTQKQQELLHFMAQSQRHREATRGPFEYLQPFERRFGKSTLHLLDAHTEAKVQTAVQVYQDSATVTDESWERFYRFLGRPGPT